MSAFIEAKVSSVYEGDRNRMHYGSPPGLEAGGLPGFEEGPSSKNSV